MIRPRVNCKLEGIHYSAFHAFCDRIEEKITKRAILKLIEMLPEYQQLTSLRVDAVKDTKFGSHSQA